MTHLFSTWRMSYIEAPKHEGCIFCGFPQEHRDAERLIVHRGGACFVIMNLYPYNPGHVMVVPYRHTC
ncbi:MAG: HIT family hydrolase, partial [Synergistaceae bacterium]|nr:HIT family hydrolase [Synergistaceae bacterium]